jgi:transposase
MPYPELPVFAQLSSLSTACWRNQVSSSLNSSALFSFRATRKREGSSIHFRAQKMLSSGVLEGLNNKAKVTMKKSHGFRTFRTLELALYYSPGKLPEAESTHDFF